MGPPKVRLTLENQQFAVYSELRTDIGCVVAFLIPICGVEDETSLFCLKFDIDSEGLVEAYETNSTIWSRSSKGRKDLICMRFFWSQKELEIMGVDAELLKPELESLPPSHLWSMAVRGDADAQFMVYRRLLNSKPSAALGWLCQSADQGNSPANRQLGFFHELGDVPLGPSENPIREKNYIKAYVWYRRSGMDEQRLQDFVDARLNSENYQKAQEALAKWRPGQCAVELGLSDEYLSIENLLLAD